MSDTDRAAEHLDAMPSDPMILAAMTPEERSAIYLNSIRKMLSFLVVLVIIGIVVGAVMLGVHSGNS